MFLHQFSVYCHFFARCGMSFVKKFGRDSIIQSFWLTQCCSVKLRGEESDGGGEMMQSSHTDPEFGQPAALGGRAVNEHSRSCTVPGEGP